VEEAIVTNRAAETAVGPMSIVAAEQYTPQSRRLVQDDLAIHFLPRLARWIVSLTRWPPAGRLLIYLSEKRAPGIYGYTLCRKRYVDEKTLDAINAGVMSVVILGAGLDTRAYRMEALAAMPVFEVDLPMNVEYKQRKVLERFGTVPANVTLVPVDFNRQDLRNALAQQGHRAEQKSLFIWEAVIPYLSAQGVRRTFDYLETVASGSRLVFTYIRKDFIEGRNLYGAEALYRAFVQKAQLFHFGWEPEEVAPFLAEYGWRELEQVGSQEYMERYMRPSGRNLPVSEIERAVYAEKL
jgi:methyltransferase (TIGR00027 family)